jgi:hypothetical protein
MSTIREKHRLFIGHTEYAADIDVDHLSYVRRYGAWRVGFLGGVLRSGEILRTTEFYPNGAGHTFEANQFMTGISVGRLMTDRFTVAMTGKFFQENLDEFESRGLFVDLGALYYVGFRRARLGFTVRNFGGDLRLNGDLPENSGFQGRWQTFPAPTVAVFGGAYDFGVSEERRLTLSFDFNHPSDESESIILGAEMAMWSKLYLRGGYRNNIDEGGLSAGFGLHLDRKKNLVRFGYAFDDRGAFGGLHIVSLELGR